MHWVLPDEQTMAVYHSLLEEKMLNRHYYKLGHTLTDVDNLLLHFLQQRVITVNDLVEIYVKETKERKVQWLMDHISGPLRTGNTKVFYTMLKIMEEYGHHATKQLANQIRKSLLDTCK